jgi:hypothetical protein
VLRSTASTNEARRHGYRCPSSGHKERRVCKRISTVPLFPVADSQSSRQVHAVGTGSASACSTQRLGNSRQLCGGPWVHCIPAKRGHHSPVWGDRAELRDTAHGFCAVRLASSGSGGRTKHVSAPGRLPLSRGVLRGIQNAQNARRARLLQLRRGRTEQGYPHNLLRLSCMP